MLKLIGWIGSIAGLIGSLLLALNNSYSGWGFVGFLISNAAWFYYGIRIKMFWRITDMIELIFTIFLTTVFIFLWAFYGPLPGAPTFEEDPTFYISSGAMGIIIFLFFQWKKLHILKIWLTGLNPKKK